MPNIIKYDPNLPTLNADGALEESRSNQAKEGGPGSGPHGGTSAGDIMSQHAARIPKKEWIEKAGGEYLGAMDDGKGGKIHGFKDPKTGSTMWMKDKDINSQYDVKDHMEQSREKFRRGQGKEAQEYGVKGMEWGTRHVRKDAAGQKHPTTGKPQSAPNRSIDKDRTLSQMGRDQSTPQTQSDARFAMLRQKGQDLINQHNAQNQQSGRPQNPKDAHAAMTDSLKSLGWKIAGVVAGLAGVGGTFQTVRSIVQTPDGKKMILSTNQKGNHSLQPQTGNRTRTSVRESLSFDQRLGSFLREARGGKVYYARSLQRYESNREAEDLDDLEEEYPDDRITFPRTRRHSELGMGYFHKRIDKAKEVVITGLHHRRKVTAGVASEARHALKKGIKVRFLHHGKFRTVESIENITGGKPDGHYARVIFKKRRRKK